MLWECQFRNLLLHLPASVEECFAILMIPIVSCRLPFKSPESGLSDRLYQFPATHSVYFVLFATRRLCMQNATAGHPLHANLNEMKAECAFNENY